MNSSRCADVRCSSLEAGVGLCGLLAAKLGAKEVVLTDFEHPLLVSLCEAVDDNRLGSVARVAKLDWLEEAAEAEVQSAVTAGAAGVVEGAKTGAGEGPGSAEAGTRDATSPTACGGGGGGGWASLAPGETFDFVFGSDLLYEALHAEALPKVVKRRLAPSGRCRIVGAVRNRALLDTLCANLEKEGFDVTEQHLDNNHGEEYNIDTRAHTRSYALPTRGCYGLSAPFRETLRAF